MKTKLGIIEGFYGRPWTWGERSGYVPFMRRHGFKAYIYAPKADAYMRRRWREPMPPTLEAKLARLSSELHNAGCEFGIGFSPYEIYLSPFDLKAKEQLMRRVQAFDRIRTDILCILMDDMKGDVNGLAGKQIEILNFIASNTKAKKMIFCPTYYSDDPVLERLYGKMPEDYFSRLNSELDQKISVFWTGNLVCSTSFEPEYLQSVSLRLGRKPVIWDNYPVNDGPRMSPFLHLRAFSGRPAEMGSSIEAHIANPMNQAALSKIVLATLAECYERGPRYDEMAAFRRAARSITCREMADLLERDLELFADNGLSAITAERKAELLRDYAEFLGSRTNDTAAAAHEITYWLNGRYAITREEILAQ